jgi:glutamate-ammonia-ligase adenylyltransferase
MRALMERERAAKGFWDLKLVRGGLVDIEFVAQFLQIVAAADGGPLVPHTGRALDACAEAGLADSKALASLKEAWTLQQELSQILKVAFPGDVDPAAEPAGFRTLLARAGGVRDLKSLTAKLVSLRAAAKRDYEKLVV